MLAILFTGIVSAQTFNFACGTSSLPEGFSAFVGEPGQAGPGSIKTYVQYSIPEHLRSVSGQTGAFWVYAGIDRNDPVKYSELVITDGVITGSSDFMEGVTHTIVDGHTIVFQNVTQGLYNHSRIRITALDISNNTGELVFAYRNGSVQPSDFPNWRQEIRDAIQFYYGPVEGSDTFAYYNTVLTLPTHLIGVDFNRQVIRQTLSSTDGSNGTFIAGEYILEGGGIRAIDTGGAADSVVQIGAYSWGITTQYDLPAEHNGKTYLERAYSRARITSGISGVPIALNPPRTLAFYPGWQDELDQALRFDIRDGNDANWARSAITLTIPQHLRGVTGINRRYDTSNRLDESSSSGLSGYIKVVNGAITNPALANIYTYESWTQRNFGTPDWNESRMSMTVNVGSTQILNYQFGILAYVWNWVSGGAPNLTIKSGTKSIDLWTGERFTATGTYDFGNGNTPAYSIGNNTGYVQWYGAFTRLNFPGSATTDGIHRSHLGGANWLYRVNITETEREFVRYWYEQAGYTPEEY